MFFAASMLLSKNYVQQKILLLHVELSKRNDRVMFLVCGTQQKKKKEKGWVVYLPIVCSLGLTCRANRVAVARGDMRQH